MALQLVPRSSRAVAENLNTIYRVLRGVDPDSLALRLPASGSFQVQHSTTASPVLLVTDAGIDGSDIVPGTITSDKLAGGIPVPPGSLTTAQMAPFPHVIATRSGVQSIAHNTVTPMTWDGTDVTDSGNLHDPASGAALLVAPVAGLYLATLWIWWDVATTGIRYATILHMATTGISSSRINAVAGNYTEQQVSGYTRLAAGEYISASVQQTQTAPASLNVLAASRFSMAWISN
jgi:hypothetical protein